VAVVETHVSDTNLPAMQLFGKLGFESREHGTRYRLPADRPA
jgi:hypothetical protein